jgi:hypothetical protein
MAAFLRGKQTGMQNDLSASIRPELFMPDDQARYGINSQIRYRSISPNMYHVCMPQNDPADPPFFVAAATLTTQSNPS